MLDLHCLASFSPSVTYPPSAFSAPTSGEAVGDPPKGSGCSRSPCTETYKSQPSTWLHGWPPFLHHHSHPQSRKKHLSTTAIIHEYLKIQQTTDLVSSLSEFFGCQLVVFLSIGTFCNLLQDLISCFFIFGQSKPLRQLLRHPHVVLHTQVKGIEVLGREQKLHYK